MGQRQKSRDNSEDTNKLGGGVTDNTHCISVGVDEKGGRGGFLLQFCRLEKKTGLVFIIFV